MKEKIILVFKTHFDLGFTDLSEKVMQDYAGDMLRQTIETCEATKDMGDTKFVWTMAAWPLYNLLERTKGSLHEDLVRMVAERRIVWHALPYTMHTDFSSIEEMIAGLRYGQLLSEKFEIPLKKTAKMTDVPGHGRMLPTILSQAGVEFLHLGSNSYATSPDVPRLFWWEGTDGSRTLTMYVSDGYGSSMIPPNDWKYPVWMAFMHTHDNIGPQSAQTINEIVAEVKKQRPNAEVVTGTMDDFYSELSKCDLSDIPLVSKDLADSWIHGAGTYPKEVRTVRDARYKQLVYDVYSALNNSSDDFQEIRNEVYDNLTMFSEHTWGLDVKTWLGPKRTYDKKSFINNKDTLDYKYMEESWDEQRNRANNALKDVNAGLIIAQKDKTPGILNPNADTYSGWCTINQPNSDSIPVFSEERAYIKDLKPLSFSLGVKAQKLATKQLEVREKGDTVVVENHKYAVSFSTISGEIEDITDKSLNEVILKKREHGVFSYLYVKYGSDAIDKYLADYGKTDEDWGFADNGRQNYPKSTTEYFLPKFVGWQLDGCNLLLSYEGIATEEYGDSKGIKTIVTLPPLGEELFVEVMLEGKQATPFVETASVIMPLAWQKPNYKFNKNGYEINPETDIAYDANHAFYCLENYARADNGSVGVCVVSHDTPLVSIGETAVETFRPDYEEHQPELYFNLLNNMWGTNFPQWIEGDFSFRYTIFGYSAQDNITNHAFACHQPPIELKGIESCCPVELPSDTRVVSYRPYAGEYLVRILDTSGKDRTVELKSSEYKMRRIDLYGRVVDEQNGNNIEFKLPKNGMATIKLSK